MPRSAFLRLAALLLGTPVPADEGFADLFTAAVQSACPVEAAVGAISNAFPFATDISSMRYGRAPGNGPAGRGSAG